VLVKGEEGGHALEVPFDVREMFGNGTPFSTRIAVFGGKYYLWVQPQDPRSGRHRRRRRVTIELELAGD
jgi:hypothetical protein